MIIIRPLRPKTVKIDRHIVEEILEEEKRLEEEKIDRALGKVRS